MSIDISKLEFGLDTFGDVAFNEDGSKMTYRESLQNILKEGQLADALGYRYLCFGRTSS